MNRLPPAAELVEQLALRAAGRADWDRLWALLQVTLGRLRPGILRNLRESPEELLQSFVVDKLLEKDYDFPTFGKLIAAYTHYLTDVYRREQHRLLSDDIFRSGDDDGGESFIPELVSTENVESNASRNRLMAQASHFFAQLEEDAKRYLGQSMCADDGEALHKLAMRYKIANYHKRARKLGIVQNKQAITAGDYAKTDIGQWIVGTLGIPLEHEHLHDITQAVEALCAQALLWATPAAKPPCGCRALSADLAG